MKFIFISLYSSGNENIAKLAIENGADVNKKQNYGYTALHSAAHQGNLFAIFFEY